MTNSGETQPLTGDTPSDDGQTSADQRWQLAEDRHPFAGEPTAWPVARVELYHPERGRVTDIASAPGAFDAAFKAAAEIVGITPRLISYNVRSASHAADGALCIQLDIRLEIDGTVYRGSSFGVDLMRCSIDAWLDAASKARPDDGPREKDFRAHQISAVDENDDLWIFASSDESAVGAIAEEFAGNGYSNIQRLSETV